jgi:hypothetical protein
MTHLETISRPRGCNSAAQGLKIGSRNRVMTSVARVAPNLARFHRRASSNATLSGYSKEGDEVNLHAPGTNLERFCVPVWTLTFVERVPRKTQRWRRRMYSERESR